MTSHKDWFRELQMSDLPDYVEIRDDTIHPIQHVGNVTFRNDGKQTYINNDLHVRPSRKSLVLVDQIVEQGM